jgi:hypothetical protein
LVSPKGTFDAAKLFLSPPHGSEIDRRGARRAVSSRRSLPLHQLQRRAKAARRSEPLAERKSLAVGQPALRNLRDAHDLIPSNRNLAPTPDVAKYRDGGSFVAVHVYETALLQPWVGLLPVVPAATFGGSDEEAEHPEDQPDDEQNPEDVERRRYQTAPAEEQQQQDQNDQRNHS